MHPLYTPDKLRRIWGTQFAYNEVSFMLVRLLQQFETIELTPRTCPDSIPPPTFTDSIGCDGTETAWVSSHLTIFAKVSAPFHS